jgi:hypothetical protein
MTGCEDTWLDEALEILTAAWSGTRVHHRGRALHGELAEQKGQDPASSQA